MWVCDVTVSIDLMAVTLELMYLYVLCLSDSEELMYLSAMVKTMGKEEGELFE